MHIHDFKSTSITLVKSEVDFDRLKLLFLEFATSIDFDLCYQSFLKELSSVTELYSAPNGVAFILTQNNNTIGCVGIREVKPGVAVVKRLYLRSDYKRPHFGKKLLKVAIEWSRQKGMRKIQIDPDDIHQGISKLCIEAGFSEITTPNELTTTSRKCFEFKLSSRTEFSAMMAS